MTIFLKTLDLLISALLSALILVSPWMLGAWEMWYFWPSAVVLFVCLACAGLRWVLGSVLALQRADDPPRPALPVFDRRGFLLLAGAWMPFLVYATVRFAQTPVAMDAERIWLLIVTSAMVIVIICLQFNERQAQRLFWLMAAGMALQSIYGFVGFYVFQDRYVMWVPNIFGYPNRMKGSFFCPNHFAGFLEMGFCMALAGILDRKLRRPWRLAAASLLALTAAGVARSLSRGGWMTLVVILLAAAIWGLGQLTSRQTMLIRAGTLSVIAVAGLLLFSTDNPARRRLYHWHAFNPEHRDAGKNFVADILQRVRHTSRGRQIGGALRAWKTRPVWGIGPGMHQNLWFQFADSGDGDRESGKWPSQTNHTFHSYEVHSDWVQLLQEFGVVGFGLFMIGFGTLSVTFIRGVRGAARRGKIAYIALAAWLAVIAIAFHSLGDFNLQIPANTWTLAALVGLGWVSIPRERTASK